MIMIKGYVTGKVNVRNRPDEKLLDSSLIGSIATNGTFEGSRFVPDASGKNWIKLTKINGVSINDERYIAAYISTVQYTIVPDVTNPPAEDLGIPEKVTTIEEFRLSDGSIKKRTVVWDNPQIIEE